MDKNVSSFMKKLRALHDFNRVRFIILYGSRSLGFARKDSDYDFAIYYEGDKGEKFDFLIKANFDDRFDAKIFQDLPLYIKKEVFKGRVVYLKNKDLIFVYDVAYETIKDFEQFKRYYYDYVSTRRLKIK